MDRCVSMTAHGRKLEDVPPSEFGTGREDTSITADRDRSELVEGAQFSVGIGGVFAANNVNNPSLSSIALFSFPLKKKKHIYIYKTWHTQTHTLMYHGTDHTYHRDCILG